MDEGVVMEPGTSFARLNRDLEALGIATNVPPSQTRKDFNKLFGVNIPPSVSPDTFAFIVRMTRIATNPLLREIADDGRSKTR